MMFECWQNHSLIISMLQLSRFHGGSSLTVVSTKLNTTTIRHKFLLYSKAVSIVLGLALVLQVRCH